MRCWSLAVLVVVSTVATGCVSKSDHEALQAELEACQEAKALADAEVTNWQGRFDRESARWEQIGHSVSSAVPTALTEMSQERERILNLVPDQVQSEVSTYMDDYFNAVMAGFDRMNQDNEELRVEVRGMQKALELVGHDTKAIGQAIDQSLAEEKAQRRKVTSDLSDIIEMIAEFDQTRINCKGCPDRLRMRDKTRAALLAFHQDLASDLALLQTFADAVPGEDGSGGAEEGDPAAGGEDSGEG